jgi:hypothetical protein
MTGQAVLAVDERQFSKVIDAGKSVVVFEAIELSAGPHQISGAVEIDGKSAGVTFVEIQRQD